MAVVAAVALLVAAFGPVALGDTTQRAPTGTVVAKVWYRTPGKAKAPLVGVPVWVLDTETITAWRGCTNAKGIVRFTEVSANVDLLASVEPEYGDGECSNSLLLNPDNGKQMLAVGWNNHHGDVSVDWDTFQVDRDGKTRIKFKLKTPRNQKRICVGWLATWVGTRGPDTYVGTRDRDIVNALGGNDVIRGKGGADIICGGNGKDRLFGNAGIDFLFGQGGKDKLFGGGGVDFLFGGTHRDKCVGENVFECEV